MLFYLYNFIWTNTNGKLCELLYFIHKTKNNKKSFVNYIANKRIGLYKNRINCFTSNEITTNNFIYNKKVGLQLFYDINGSIRMQHLYNNKLNGINILRCMIDFDKVEISNFYKNNLYGVVQLMNKTNTILCEQNFYINDNKYGFHIWNDEYFNHSDSDYT